MNFSYDAGFNVANRNASNPMSNTEVARMWGCSMLTSNALALGADRLILRQAASRSMSAVGRTFLQRCVPFLAVAGGAVSLSLRCDINSLNSSLPASQVAPAKAHEAMT